VRQCGSGSRSVESGCEDLILPRREDQHNCIDSRNLRIREWEATVGEDRVCICWTMIWWDQINLPCGLPNIYSPLLSPSALPLYLCTPQSPRQSLSSMYIQTPAVTSVSNSSNPQEQFRVRVGTGTEPFQWVLPHENPDHGNWTSFTTKNPAFQPPRFASNWIFELWSYRDMINS